MLYKVSLYGENRSKIDLTNKKKSAYKTHLMHLQFDRAHLLCSLTSQQSLEKWVWIMEDGGVDTTGIDSWQHKMGRMADFPPLLASSVFEL